MVECVSWVELRGLRWMSMRRMVVAHRSVKWGVVLVIVRLRKLVILGLEVMELGEMVRIVLG